MTNYKKTLTFDELVDIFGDDDVLKMCENKTEELTIELRELNKKIEKTKKIMLFDKEKNEWLWLYNIEMFEDSKKKLLIKIRGWEYKKKHIKGEEDDIPLYNADELRNISIKKVIDYLGYEGIKSGDKRWKYKIRDEKTASATIYEDSNSFYDFGASVGGDNFTLIMWATGCDFKGACRILKEMM